LVVLVDLDLQALHGCEVSPKSVGDETDSHGLVIVGERLSELVEVSDGPKAALPRAKHIGIPDKLENGSLEKPDALNGRLEHLISRFGEFAPLAILDDNGLERDEAFHGFIPWEKVEGPKPLDG
jgi:hypothetical protein